MQAQESQKVEKTRLSDQKLLQVLARDPFGVFSHFATEFAVVPPS